MFNRDIVIANLVVFNLIIRIYLHLEKIIKKIVNSHPIWETCSTLYYILTSHILRLQSQINSYYIIKLKRISQFKENRMLEFRSLNLGNESIGNCLDCNIRINLG